MKESNNDFSTIIKAGSPTPLNFTTTHNNTMNAINTQPL
jgi:hypothetical protein